MCNFSKGNTWFIMVIVFFSLHVQIKMMGSVDLFILSSEALSILGSVVIFMVNSIFVDVEIERMDSMNVFLMANSIFLDLWPPSSSTATFRSRLLMAVCVHVCKKMAVLKAMAGENCALLGFCTGPIGKERAPMVLVQCSKNWHQ